MGELRANAWLLRPALDLLNIMLIVAVIAAFGTQSIGGLQVGLLYAFITYIARVVEPLIQITLQFSLLQQAMIAAARVNTLLAEGGTPAVAAGRRIEAGGVRLSKVTFGYDPDEPVLHDLSLDIPAGRFYGVVGHTGAGKSSLLSLLLRFYTPQAGRIEIDGVPLAAIGDEQFRADVGLVPQEPFLLAASARENIDMGRASPRSGSKRRRVRRGRASSSSRWSRATTRRSARAGRGCPPARSSWSRWRARWPARRGSCSSTRRPRASTARPRGWCSRRWPSCTEK